MLRAYKTRIRLLEHKDGSAWELTRKWRLNNCHLLGTLCAGYLAVFLLFFATLSFFCPDEMRSLIDFIRPPRTLLVSRPIHLFRQPCHFEEDGPDIHHSEHYVEFKYANEQISDVKRVEISCAVQARPHLLDHATQTTWNRPVHLAIQYEPNTLDTQQLSAIQQQDTFQETIHNLEKHFDWALRENALVDLFYDHYHHLDHEDNLNVDKGVNVHLPELHAFTDLKHTKNRSVSCIQWHPTLPGLVAVSCTPRSTLDEKVEALHRVKARQALITFWNVAEPLRAQLFLEAPDEVLAFGFHPGDPFVLFAGCSNGQVFILLL